MTFHRMRLLALGVTAALSVGGAAAQTPAAPPKPNVVNPLGLSPQQERKMREITTKMAPEIQAAFTSAKTDAERQKKLAAVQKKWRPQLMKILTPAQRQKAQKLEAEAKARMRGPAPAKAR